MCIIFFESHSENQYQHYVLHYHCAHEGCDGLFESHHRFLLESPYGDCTHCLKRDGVEVDPDVKPVTYYPPIRDPGSRYVQSKEWERFEKELDRSVAYERLLTTGDGEKNGKDNEEELSDSNSLFGVNSVTHHQSKGVVEALPNTQDRTQHPSPIPESLVETKPQDVFCRPSTFQSSRSSDQDMHQAFAGQVPGLQPSPNTAKHRDLVNAQLARLPHHIAHTQPQFQSLYWRQQHYVISQRKPYYWGGPPCYAKRTPPDPWQ